MEPTPHLQLDEKGVSSFSYQLSGNIFLTNLLIIIVFNSLF